MGRILNWIQSKLRTGTLIALPLVPLGCQAASPQELYLQQKTRPANKDEIRQELLEEIVEKYQISHVTDIVYYSKQYQQKYLDSMSKEYNIKEVNAMQIWKQIKTIKPQCDAVILLPERYLGTGKKSMVIAFPILFDKSREYDEIISCIADNAGTNAKNAAIGIKMQGRKITPGEVGIDTYQLILQIFAYSHQFKQIDKNIRQVSQKYEKGVEKAYAGAYTGLVNDARKGNEYALAAFTSAPYAVFANLDTGKVLLISKEKTKFVQK